MIRGQTVGCGIVTCNRPDQLLRLYDSLPRALLDAVIVVNDGEWDPRFAGLEGLVFMQNEHNLGVAKSKNKALAYLREQQVAHVFLVEDDIHVRNPAVFEHYIRVALATGIQHLNYSQHGPMNQSTNGAPAPRMEVDFGPMLKLPLYPNCVGAFSYYSRACLDAVGSMDEDFHNALEHVDHTYAVVKAGMHPPFWYFADAPRSWLYLGDEPWSAGQSRIASRDDHSRVVTEAIERFQLKHGMPPSHIPNADPAEVLSSLQAILRRYAVKR